MSKVPPEQRRDIKVPSTLVEPNENGWGIKGALAMALRKNPDSENEYIIVVGEKWPEEGEAESMGVSIPEEDFEDLLERAREV